MQSATGQRKINRSNQPPPEVLAKKNLKKYLRIRARISFRSIPFNISERSWCSQLKSFLCIPRLI